MHVCALGVNAMLKLYVLPDETVQGRALHPGMLKESILAFGGGPMVARREREGEGERGEMDGA